MEAKKEERFAVVVGGVLFPGYNSMAEAQKAINANPVWKKKEAVARELHGEPKKGIFKESDF